PTQVSRSPSTEPLSSPRVGADKYPPPVQHDPMHHPPYDPRAKFNLQHREALRLALGSILAPKRPSTSGSRSSSGTTSPAYSFSGSSGTYTPATPPNMPYTPSLDASNSQEHPFSRLHYPYPHQHPTHPPSKLGRVESHRDEQDADASRSIPTSTTPPQLHSPPLAPPPPLFRSRSHNPSIPRPSRTGSRQATTPPLTGKPPEVTVTDATETVPSLPPPAQSVATTNSGGGRRINAKDDQMPPPSIPPPPTDVPVPAAAVIQAASTPASGTGSPSQTPSQQHPGGAGSSTCSGTGTPRAKFIQTLQGKSAWDALIHGSFS
ncbi:hypothetical protein AN958_04273, partial [Leucoagaricus sp. SymC.cos]